MASKHRAQDFAEGKRRLEEIGRRLGGFFGTSGPTKAEPAGLGVALGGLGALLDQLGKWAETAEKEGGTTSRSGEFDLGSDKRLRGVYGFSVKVGLGEQGVKVEPFGNIRKDEQSGRVEVKEIREPMVDVFDEQDHLLVIVEVPGVVQEDIHLELRDDILTLAAERGETKYRKEILLPASCSADTMSCTCRNGILEITLAKAPSL